MLICSLLLWTLPAFVQGAPASQKAVTLVTPPALAKLVPAPPDGWTRGEVKSSQVDISPESRYSLATAVYTKDAWRLKVTIADSGSRDDILFLLASVVVTLPEDCIEKVAPATTIKRMKVREHQAAELWDDATASGEIAVVVGGRFVAMVEATKAENLEAVWTLLRAIDLKAVEALK